MTVHGGHDDDEAGRRVRPACPPRSVEADAGTGRSDTVRPTGCVRDWLDIGAQYHGADLPLPTRRARVDDEPRSS